LIRNAVINNNLLHSPWLFQKIAVIAAIFEFSGAYFLGAAVTGTIRSKIVDIDLYEDEPAVLMFGMFSALFAANIMLFIATYFGYPVSTTHDIVGSIMGFSIAAKGFESVQWPVAIKIFLSWIVSPLFAGSVAACFFATVKYAVLKSGNPFQRAYWTFPIVLTGGIGINIFYVLYKAASSMKNFQEGLELYVVLPVAFGSGAFCGLIWLFVVGPIAKRRVEAKRVAYDAQVAAEKSKTLKDDELEEEENGNFVADKDKVFDVDGDDEEVPAATTTEQPKSLISRMRKSLANSTYDRDLHTESLTVDHRAAEIWRDAEEYDMDAENLFTYLQVFTACLNAFSHGANDVSNTIAPFSAIIEIYQTGSVDSSTTVQKWKLAFGGAAIVIGLFLYGYNVMKSLGYKLTMMSPSRGFCAELGASLVVVTASFNAIPVSTTQCIVGAVFGVGLVGGVKDVQWYLLLKVMLSWVGLFFCASTLAAGIFSYGAFSPSIM
jgi:sodium-dependent phosphate transporter